MKLFQISRPRRGRVIKHASFSLEFSAFSPSRCFPWMEKENFIFLFNLNSIRSKRIGRLLRIQGRCIIFPGNERKVVDARFKMVDVNYDNRVLRMRISTSGLFECRFTSVLLSLACRGVATHE